MKDIRWENAEEKREDLNDLLPCIEKMFRVTLPEDYTTCAIENGGGSPVPSRFDVRDETGKAITKLLSLDPRSKDFFWRHFTAAGWHSSGGHRGPCPIAQDEEGNYICLDYTRGTPPRILYATPGIKRPRRRVVIADSFTAFLDMLY